MMRQHFKLIFFSLIYGLILRIMVIPLIHTLPHDQQGTAYFLTFIAWGITFVVTAANL